MKSLLMSLMLCTFLISCAGAPKYRNLSCQDIREMQKDLTNSIEKVKNGKHYVRTRILLSTVGLPFLCLTEPIGLIIGTAAGYNPTEDPTVLGFQEKYNQLERAAKWKKCPKECKYEVITNKSHTSHLPH